MKLTILLAITIILLSVNLVIGQEKEVAVETFFGASAQPETLSLPLPKYPNDAKKIGFGGRVSVGVSVDGAGNVTVLDDGDGPYPVCKSVTDPPILALRQAAVMAAKEARFKPLTGNQSSVPATGRLIYIFNPPVKVRAERVSGAMVVGTTDGPGGARSQAQADPNASGPDRAQMPDRVSGGLLNGKALTLSSPTYPAAAKAVRASGAVNVQVLIGEDGNMYSAAAVSGHPLLRRASEIAACSSRFAPTLLAGRPFKVSGIIVYNYDL